MTIRGEMAAAARRARSHLGDSTGAVGGFLSGCINPDGGFSDRNDQSDLYYTVFGLGAMAAVGHSIDRESVGAYLRGFGTGERLDFVHLTCLARCLAELSDGGIDADLAGRISERLEEFRSGDGGYATEQTAERGSAYGCFLAFGAYQDIGLANPDIQGIVDCLKGLGKSDGSYGNDAESKEGTTPATAAALTVLHGLGISAGEETIEWMLRRCRAIGGFVAAKLSPVPDLLSTATALHALRLNRVDVGKLRGPCIDFIDSLWDAGGGFCGSWLDEVVDCEYTYYGLLALGNL